MMQDSVGITVYLVNGTVHEYPKANFLTTEHGSPWLEIQKVWYEKDKDGNIRRKIFTYASYAPHAVTHVIPKKPLYDNGFYLQGSFADESPASTEEV